MKLLPAASSKPAYGALCRGKSKWHEHQEGGASHGDKRALGNVLQHRMEIEKLVEPHIGEHVQHRIEKCEETEHAAVLDEPQLARNLA